MRGGEKDKVEGGMEQGKKTKQLRMTDDVSMVEEDAK